MTDKGANGRVSLRMFSSAAHSLWEFDIEDFTDLRILRTLFFWKFVTFGFCRSSSLSVFTQMRRKTTTHMPLFPSPQDQGIVQIFLFQERYSLTAVHYVRNTMRQNSVDQNAQMCSRISIYQIHLIQML